MSNQTHATAALVATVAPAQGIALQRQCTCGNHVPVGECESCKKKREGKLQRATMNTSPTNSVPPIVHDVLRSPGQPLDADMRTFMEPRFGHDFSGVRIHTDARAAESARVVNAFAYTIGKDVVFAPGQYSPATSSGKRLLAHELTHVVQQGGQTQSQGGNLSLTRPSNLTEREADNAAVAVIGGEAFRPPTHRNLALARQMDAGVLTDAGVSDSPRDAGPIAGVLEPSPIPEVAPVPPSTPTPSTPYQVCARDLQGALGLIGNHAYIEAPPNRYAIISPLCGTGLDNPITGTTAQKWDNSPDPCGKSPRCIPCQPAPGVTDVAACLRSAFLAYSNPSLYRGLGPNSNTFAGTLARSCCAGMAPKPAALGNVPGWDDAPASARAGATPCPPGPTCG